tara:strand:- start:295 stop:690 length:396 start_codon:yes stop_codon:yes gene_type:complete
MAYAPPTRLQARLFPNRFKNHESDDEKENKKPDFTGDGEIPLSVLKEYVNRAKDKSSPIIDGVIKLRVSAWKNVTQGDNPKSYLNIRFELKDYDKEQTVSNQGVDPFDLGSSDATAPAESSTPEEEDDLPF